MRSNAVATAEGREASRVRATRSNDRTGTCGLDRSGAGCEASRRISDSLLQGNGSRTAPPTKKNDVVKS
jgi:hypothetical protein